MQASEGPKQDPLTICGETSLSHSRYFRHLCRRLRPANVQPDQSGLQTLLQQYVITPFHRISHETAVIVPLNPAEPDDSDTPPANPGHPACAQYVGSDYCRESWQLHVAEARRHPEAHWHVCDHGLSCGLVPVTHGQHCLAAIRLVCPSSMPPEDFDRHLEFLDILVNNFVASSAELLNRFVEVANRNSNPGGTAPRVAVRQCQQPESVPQIRRAIQFIEDNLCDPGLSVGRVAAELGLHPNYLSGLFAAHFGYRMSRYIVNRRLELAKNLLATTDWQVKRVALSTGWAHPNWFSHIFTEDTGMSPSAYRASRRGGKAADNPSDPLPDDRHSIRPCPPP